MSLTHSRWFPSLPLSRTVCLLTYIFCGASFHTVECAAVDADADGFVPIFNGRDLSGWVVDGRKTRTENGQEVPVWTVREGVIHCAGRGGGFLRYDEELGDFIVRLEYCMSKGCNSGIGIRGVVFTGSRKTRPSFAGYEMQIVDDVGREPHKHSSGSLYRYVAPMKNATLPAGQWNRLEIECRGPKIRITLNDQLIHDFDQTTLEQTKDKPLSGYFSLQDHGKVIDYRNLRLKELGAAGE